MNDNDTRLRAPRPSRLALRLLLLLVLAAALPACASAWISIPGWVADEHLHFTEPHMRVGDVAPDFTLPRADGSGSVTLSEMRGRPVVLTFGSHTCGPFRRELDDLDAMHRELGEDVDFLLVYVREAHAEEEWVTIDNVLSGVWVQQPKTSDERRDAARQFVAGSEVSIPTVVDDVDDAVCTPYGGWPDRIYVVGPDGRVVYQGEVGPFGFEPDDVREFLRDTYGL